MPEPATSSVLTLGGYTRAVQDLPVEQVYAELARLDKSEQRLRATNAQLKQEEPCAEFIEAIADNEALLEAYVGRRQAIYDDLKSRGAMLPPGRAGSAANSSSSSNPAGVFL
jgi:hypothetical protein